MSTDAISHSLELISSDIGYIIFIVISKTRQELEMETNNLERTNISLTSNSSTFRIKETKDIKS